MAGGRNAHLLYAPVLEVVDRADSKSAAMRREGSSPSRSTKCRCSVSGSTSAFQADRAGSNPVTDSIIKGGKMMKYYRMAIVNLKTGEKDTYVSVHQGSAPPGWKCVGVLGYFEK